MSTKKENAIQKISEDFELFSRTTVTQLAMLEKIITTREQQKADEIIEKILSTETKIDKFEVKISERIINTIVLYQPVAGELRRLMAIYRMVINLERIGDYILHISNVIREISQIEVLERNYEMIENALTLTSNMLSRALFSFKNEDVEYAKWAIRSQQAVRDIRKNGVKEAIIAEKLDAKTTKLFNSYFDLKQVISNIAHIADHASSIAEASIFALDGRDVRHQRFEDEGAIDPDTNTTVV